ncbi:hypothetical protein CYMTET_31102 [Cymbomonas tetramitiformis]|uniref:Uncharacterized protein n=1 Tax=Cymbomonas tetramitiformis TaxID=36881 RepID=A0AAE0FHG0_9CHLO|nr:hypothetical protein CYMTET_31102 [Cymbomonas tetramitiformis]
MSGAVPKVNPQNDKVFKMLGDETPSTEHAKSESQRVLLDERLSELRKIDKELNDDSWIHNTLEDCSSPN